MDHTKYFKQRITPFDLGIEWLIKGANIGMIYGLCFLPEVEKKSGIKELMKDRFKFVARNSWQTGGVLGTWWFFMKSSEVVVGKEHWGNYSVAGVITLLIWRKALEVPRKKVLSYVPLAASFCGGLGLIILEYS